MGSSTGIVEGLLEYDEDLFNKHYQIENDPPSFPVPHSDELPVQSIKQDWERVGTKRLRLKFKYYLLKSKAGENAKGRLLEDKTLKRIFGQSFRMDCEERQSWVKYTDFWDRIADFEERAYIHRICQHMDADLVASKWYGGVGGTNEFRTWSEACERKLEMKKREVVEKTRKPIETFPDLRSRFMISGSSDIYSEQIRDWLEKCVFDSLACLTDVLHYNIVENKPQSDEFLRKYYADDRIVDRWFASLLDFAFQHDKLDDEHRNRYSDIAFHEHIKTKLFSDILETVTTAILNREGKDEIVERFLNNIRESEAFKCRVCDFLEVKSRQVGGMSNLRLELFASTVKGPLPHDIQEKMSKSPAEAYDELRGVVGYDENVGISGSIFVAPENKEWFHVGTNCLKKDYRQSVSHADVYNELYGIEVNNFWLFPIYEDGKLKYALRVVDKLDPDNPNLLTDGGWRYLTRLQLCELARCFGELLKFYTSLSSMASFVETLKTSRLDIDWLSDKTLEESIKHLAGVAFRKVEARRMGCAIMIVDDKSMGIVQRLIPEDNKSEIDISGKSIEEMHKYYDAIDSRTSCTVYTENLTPAQIYKFSTHEEMMETMKKAVAGEVKANAILFHLLEGTETIRIFQGGDLQGEVYFSERYSEWKFRHYGTILTAITSHAKYFTDDDESFLKKILHVAYKLSQEGHGALIVLGDEPLSDWKEGKEFSFQDVRLKKGLDTEKTDVVELKNLAKKDGATIVTKTIEPGGGAHAKYVVKWANVKINIKPPQKEELDRKFRNNDRLKRIYEERGSRHKTAVLVSLEYRNSLVLAVSENRGITILCSNSVSPQSFPMEI